MSKLVEHKDKGLNGSDKRLNPEVMSLALLDEIAERLKAVQETLAEERAEGIIEPRGPLIVTDEGRSIIPPKTWFSFVLLNDGPNTLYVLVNRDKNIDRHTMYNGESFRVDMHRARITDLFLRCDPGNRTTIRLVGTR